MQIVVIESGWVFVGECERSGNALTLSDGYNIRRWGTTAGLGQLAATGPTKDTELDPVHFIEVPMGKVLFTMPVLDAAKAKFDAG
jgi:hypothetical protein